MIKAVAIFGNTNAGKTTLGRNLERVVGCRHVCFGDIKREYISNNSEVGQRISQCIQGGLPIRPDDAMTILETTLDGIGDLVTISGFPISTQELDVFQRRCVLIGFIHLEVNVQTAFDRFVDRRVCPICAHPGKKDGGCPTHKDKVLVQRCDLSFQEFRVRVRLYNERINPFLKCNELSRIPQLSINTDKCCESDVLSSTLAWFVSNQISQKKE